MKRDLAGLAGREHDLLVIGGGIYGAAAVWDAAQRGLQAALVERDDFGGGTSWNSLRTIHGGLRHLQRGELALLRESVRERRAFLRVAPELVRPLRFVVPAYGAGLGGKEALAFGVRAYDLLGLDRNRALPGMQRLPRARVLTRAEVLRAVPGIPEAGLRGGVEWSDAQVTSSERLLLAFLHAAAARGAQLANYVEAKGLLRCGSGVAGARCQDRETAQDLVVRSRFVLCAAGPWTDALLAGIVPQRDRVPLLKAWNLVLRQPGLPHAVAGRVGRRFFFLVPWHDRSIVGTAYAPAGVADERAQLAGFIADARRAFPWAGIEPDRIALVQNGLVPGTDGGRGLWSRSRVLDHERAHGVPGLVSILGAKYTTARAAAEKALDLVCGRVSRRTERCRTAASALQDARVPDGALDERVRQAVHAEMAIHLEDAVLRRLELSRSGLPDPAEVDRVAALMAVELDWSSGRLVEEKRRLEQALVKHRPPFQ
jgi:glycerol-3-phosphate dehydrogenase